MLWVYFYIKGNHLTKEEYQKKLDAIAVSDASPEIKEKAVKALRDKHTKASDVALQQFRDSAPDISDIGGHSS